MKFYRGMMVAGAVLAVLGMVTLIFQATLFIVFQVWYSFSILDLLQRFDLRLWLATGVAGFDSGVDWVLGIPLPVALLVLGGLVGLFGYKEYIEADAWHRLQ